MRKECKNTKSGSEGVSRIFPHLIEMLARWLENRTSRYSKTKALVILLIFCMGSTILLLGIATGGFNNAGRIPYNLERLKQETLRPAPDQKIIPSRDEIIRRLENGRRYLDSLAQTPALKEKFDSLILARPGLLDSLRRAEDYYKN